MRCLPLLPSAGPPPAQAKLIAQQHPEDVGKITIVLDMDETLVYARSGIVHRRPYLREFMAQIKGLFEVVLWTSGRDPYATRVMRQVDTMGAFRHSIVRDPRWFPDDASGDEHRPVTKRLELLGRDLGSTLLIENSPESCLADRYNSLLVPDFECRSLSDLAECADTALLDLLPLLVRLHESRLPVSAFLYQIWKEGLVSRVEPVSPLAGPLGHFYHLGQPARTAPEPGPEKAAWPKDAW